MKDESRFDAYLIAEAAASFMDTPAIKTIVRSASAVRNEQRKRMSKRERMKLLRKKVAPLAQDSKGAEGPDRARQDLP